MWQPIETAPKDGTEILVYFETLGVKQVSWYDDLWAVDDGKHGPYFLRGYRDGDDTHWMPLPAGP